MLSRTKIPERNKAFWNAWIQLGSCRPQAMEGVSRIPWTACDAYARRHGFDGEEFDLLVYFVEELDSELSVWAHEKSENRRRSGDHG